eukprot:1159221-Pelagomonas_calceolata.AAC.19
MFGNLSTADRQQSVVILWPCLTELQPAALLRIWACITAACLTTHASQHCSHGPPSCSQQHRDPTCHPSLCSTLPHSMPHNSLVTVGRPAAV